MIDFSEMLPVGMVSHGGEVAQILAELAQQARGLAGWEAFHYERISESCFELTGGIVSQNAGAKRWLEPHDCISIPMSMLVAEMQVRGLLESAAPEVTIIVANDAPKSDDVPQILELRFALPKDEIGRQRVLRAFHLQADFFGATVLSCRIA